jgi:hypothetical protein
MSRRALTKSEIERLVGKRVRIWLDKTRGAGRVAEGIVSNVGVCFVSFPVAGERGNWVVTATRVLDVFEDDQWVEMFPRKVP